MSAKSRVDSGSRGALSLICKFAGYDDSILLVRGPISISDEVQTSGADILLSYRRRGESNSRAKPINDRLHGLSTLDKSATRG